MWVLVSLVIIEVIYRPRLDFGKGIWLWYGRRDRKYIIIYYDDHS